MQKIQGNEVTAQECIQAIFENIHKHEPRINAYVTLVEQEALKKAKQIDRKIAKGKPVGKLAGVAIAVKDAICTEGIATTCSSLML
ncbi:MAG: Asp-tRNA(Asn)/Glu-tRNA(Gln) amidotransferase subunit GatA, partial [Candidatus Bathyarchaeota archaeon]|nr:Asp-tRNA(Asn)/Glu-tRNA(Gln) amidotransferase subunit GatA [Candidatus Bathyarchaeum sp.]